MKMPRVMFLVGCAVLLVSICGSVDARPRPKSKKSKPAVATTTVKSVKSSDAPSENPKDEKIPAEAEESETSKPAESETSASPKPAVPQATPDPGWEFSITPYAFLAGLDGVVGVAGQTADVNFTFRDIFENLDFAFMTTVEGRKGNWSVIGDFMYIKLSGQKVTPSPFFGDIDVEVKETIIQPAVAYRVFKGEASSIDLYGGARIWHVKSHLVFQPRILPLVDVEGSKNWVEPIVGVRGSVKLSPRVFLHGLFDVGGFGVSSDFTGQAFGGGGFQLTPKIALIGGYRYLRVDYVKEGFIFKTAMGGLALGAKFNF